MGETAFASGQAVGVSELARAGLLRISDGIAVSAQALFVPADAQAESRPVQIGTGCQIGPSADLVPPSFGYAARVGSGATVLAGVSIGEHALIGVGSVVTRDVRAGAVAYGVPARVRSGSKRAAS